MNHVVEISGNKIWGKCIRPTDVLYKNEQFILKELYMQLIRLPADFETDAEGNIISVTPAPEPEPIPQPPTSDERLQALEEAMIFITLGGM
jgi:hypothetical protein